MTLRAARFAVCNGAVALLGVLAAAFVAIWLPAVAAAVCPDVYGFAEAAPDLYIERGASAAEVAATIAAVDAGRSRVVAFWGAAVATPRLLICRSEACFARLGGEPGERGLAVYDRVAVLSPRGTEPGEAAYALSTIELNHRLGVPGFVGGAVPAPLREGIATLAATPASACDGTPDAPLAAVAAPRGQGEAADRPFSGRLACAAQRWLTAHGGPAALAGHADEGASGFPGDAYAAVPQVR